MGRQGGQGVRRASTRRWLRRERLHLLLADASDARLTLLLAPAGWGKSVLLREFAEDNVRRGIPVTWIDTVPAMAGPAEVATRLDTARAGADRAAEPALLVVDDVHAIEGTPGEAALFEQIDRLPMTTSVLVATRKAPAYDLSSWRVADDLVEIGFDDLRFLTREVHALFEEVYGAPISVDEVALVVEQTDGWAAALRLLESSTRGRQPADRRGMLAMPASRWPAVGDYVRANVLAGVDDEVRRILVDAGVLGRLTDARVDELLDRPGSGPALAELRRRRLLVDDFLSDGYRVPRWLAVHLDDERAARLGPAGARAWLARAGELLLRDGEVVEAARCFAAADRNDELLRMLDGSEGERLAARPGDWLRSRPLMLERHPRVALARARQRLAAGDLAGAVAFYRRAEAAGSTESGAGRLADLRQERAAVEVWLDPEPPAEPFDGPVSWATALRRATHVEPRLMAQELLGRPHATPAERLAGALALLLAGDVDECRRLTGDLSRDATGHPSVPVVARLVRALLDAFVFPSHAGLALPSLRSSPPQPSHRSVDVVTDLESVIAEAERLDLSGLATLASVLLELLAESTAGVGRLVAARHRKGDRWGAMLVALVGGVVSARLGDVDTVDQSGSGPGEPSAFDLLDEAVTAARQLSAGVVEAWARAAAAMLAARQASPEATAVAVAAEHAGRDVGVPGVQAVAQAALALVPALRQDEHRAAAEALAAATCASGVPIVARMLGSARARSAAATRVFGRDAELAALVGRYETIEEQGGAVMRVAGEAGIGKTTLLAAFGEQVRQRGGQVRSATMSRTEPGRSLDDALVETLSEGLDPETLRVVLGFDISSGEARRHLDDDRRAELLGRMLDWAARRRPLVLVVDDADRADAPSLRLLLDVVGSMRILPLLVILSYREDELDAEAVDVLDASTWSGPVLRLDVLGGDDLRALIASELGLEPPPALVAAVHRLTGGTPGFVRETVARLGPAVTGDETYTGLAVPEGLQELLQRRMARLTPTAAELVRVTAVLGEPVDEDVAAAATGMSAAEAAASLAAAAHQRIAVRVPDGQWRFTSSIFGRVLAAEVPERQRVRAHRRAADHLESRAGSPDGPDAEALAEHLLAAHEPNATRTVRWIAQAAAEAERRGDIDRAVNLCQRALDQVGADPAARGRLLLRVASARRRRGGDTESVGPFLAAVNAARAADDPELLARAVVGYARALREFWRVDDELVPLLEEALLRLPVHDSGLRVQVEARLAEAIRSHWQSSGRDRRADLTTEACDRAYRLADPAAVASALAAWYWTLTGLEDASARLDAAAELARHAADAADWELVLDARRFRHHDLLGQGDIARADIELATFGRLAREHPTAGSPWRLGVARAGRALLDGRFDDAEALSRDALESVEPLTASGLPVETRVAQQLVRARELGELDAMEPVVRELVETRPERPMWRAAQAWLLAQTGHLAGARAELDRLVLDDLAAIESGPYWLPAVWLLGEVAVRVGRRNEAERLYRALLPWSDAIVVVPMSAAVLGSVAKVLGQLAAALGDLDDAVAHFEAAIDREIRLGAGPLLAWTRLAYARTLLLAGDQPVLGDAVLADAIESARGYGMQGVLRAAEDLAQRAAVTGATGPERSPTSSPAGLIAGSRGVVRRPRPTSRLRVLGGFELELRGRPIDVRALKPRVRAVLWVLVAHAGRPVHSEQLIEALWPGVPSEAGRRNLQVAISSLRQSLEPGVKRGPWQTVARDGDTYRLVLGEDVDADIRTFELAVAAARTLRSEGRRTDAADRFEQALRTYGGELIPEAGPADWIVGRRDGLRLAAAEAAQAAAELRLEAGEVTAAIAACERGLQIDRYRDGLWRLLVRCCEADGNPAAAARAQREYEAVLAELGLSPQ